MDILFTKPYYNGDQAANTVSLVDAFNVCFEAIPTGGYAIRRRPGLTAIEKHNEYVGQGLYWSDRKKGLYYALNGKLYVKTSATATSKLIGAIPGNVLPAVFAEGQLIDLTPVIYAASGGKLRLINANADTISTPADLTTPQSTFIASLNNRFIANDILHDQDFLITDYNPDPAVEVLDATYWSSSANPFRATQKADPITGIYTGWNEIYIWGSQLCEVWQEDGINPISPLIGSSIEAGCCSPYSVVMANNTVYAIGDMSGKRAIITISNRNPSIVSEPIANIIQGIHTVDDAIGSLCFAGGLNLYIISFPASDLTLVYDFKNDIWSKWSSWDLSNARHKLFSGTFHTFAKSWGKYVSLSQSGNLYEVSRSAYTDDGNPIRSSVITGWIDHGTYNRKRSDQLIIKLKGYNPSAATILVRWRDDGRPEWSSAAELPIQSGSQNSHYAILKRMGVYRSRQYEFIMTDAADMALMGMEEEVLKLRN
jgi:hypothetical protein